MGAPGLLSNAGLESDSPGPTANIIGWQTYGHNVLSKANATLAHSGTNYLSIVPAPAGKVNYNGIYQDYISAPGITYNADGWVYPLKLAGQSSAWIEITFRDAGAKILALYRSSLITADSSAANGSFPNHQWHDLSVTHQLNPTTYKIIHTTKQLFAPPGTIFVRAQIVFQGDASNSASSAYFDDVNLIQVGGSPEGQLNLVWSDEFNGNSINTNLWTYDTGSVIPSYNKELEYYTSSPNNSFVANGFLHLIARKESMEGSRYTSARLKTEGRFSWCYGRYEWRAKLPCGAGIWPALWMLGTNSATVGWPQCGEIDVMENIGDPLTIWGSLHSGSAAMGGYKFTDGNTATNFNTYTLDWTTNAILFYVNGHLYETQTNWTSPAEAYPLPFNRPFFLLMNLAVGGSWPGNPDAHTIFPSEMLIDYVRIYNLTAPFPQSRTLDPTVNR